MAKQTKKGGSQKQNNEKKKGAVRAVPSRAKVGGAGVGNYLRLLADPCGAEMVRAPYLGTGSGYLMRTKTWIPTTQSSGAVDFYAEVHPGGVSTSGGANTMGSYGYSTTAGGSLGVATPINFPSFFISPTVGYFRPVAGCVRVHYLGSEMDRRGMIGVSLTTGLQVFPTETIGFTTSDVMGTMQRTVRLGSEAIEVRYVPQESDGEWSSATQIQATTPALNWKGSSLQVVGQNIFPGSVTLEVTFVWEWQVSTQSASTGNASGIQPTLTKPPSFTLNDALSKIGDVVKFATSPDGRAQVVSAVKGVYNAMGMVATGVAAAM